MIETSLKNMETYRATAKAPWEKEHDAAATYHNLGYIAQEQRDFAAAERWYLQSLEINEKIGNEHDAAATYHNLGHIAQEQRDFVAAERWYLQSLEIKEKQGNEHGAASTYHQLGSLAQEQRDFAAAERWYLQALEIFEKQGNEYGAASTYHQLSMISEKQLKFYQAAEWAIKSIGAFRRCNDFHNAKKAFTYFIRYYYQLKPDVQKNLKSTSEKLIGEFSNELIDIGKLLIHTGRWKDALYVFNAAENIYKNSNELNVYAEILYLSAYVNHLLGNLISARGYYRDAIRIFEHIKDIKKIAMCKTDLGRLMIQTGCFDKALSEFDTVKHSLTLKEDSGFINLLNDNIRAAQIFKESSLRRYN